MTDEGIGTRDEGRRRSEIRGQQLQIKSAKDLKVYFLSSFILATCRGVARRAKIEAVVHPPSVIG